MTFEMLSRDVEVRMTYRLFGNRKHDDEEFRGGENWVWRVRARDAVCTMWKRNDEFGGPSNVPREATRHITIILVLFHMRFEIEICVPLRAALDDISRNEDEGSFDA